MGFAIVFEGLKKSVSKFNAVYAEGYARRPLLAPYARASELLDALKMSSPLSLEERDIITLTLIAEQQRAAHPLWQTLLLAAYEPMLRRLRGRLGKGDDAELDQRVVMAFLEAAQQISLHHPPERAALHLKRETERAIWRTRSEQRRDAAMAQFDEETAPCNPHAEPEAFLQCAKNEIAAMIAEGSEGKEILDLVLATKSGGETLHEYVARVYPNLDDAGRHATYNRLQKQRHRALVRLSMRVRGREAVMRGIA